MFEFNGNIKFINIDSNYVKKLNLVCPEVYYKSVGYDNKPYIGILINEENRSYVIPLSSAKEKHKNWKNINQECYLVYEYALKSKMGDADIWVRDDEENLVKHIMAVIDIKKMIPVKPGVYKEVNLNKENADTPEMVKYKDLMNKEYSFCLKIAGDLIKKANRLYKSQVTTGKVKKFCCDFKLLEQVCDAYVI